jgi:deazaflavin-dependent oxidoreductase (nitroreductase family)
MQVMSGGVGSSVRRKVFGARVFGTAGFAAVGRRVAPPADLALQRLSGGRVSLTGMGGLPFLVLHTVGRRSGLPRTTPLIYARAEGGDGGFLVVGSNWGQPGQPAWALNLRSEPQVSVEVRGRRRAVTARLLEGEERAEAWQRLLAFWPAYDDYAERASGRELWVFLLKPTD